jgi:hypothetical protein
MEKHTHRLMFVSCEQNAEQKHKTNTANKLFGNAEKFGYLGTALKPTARTSKLNAGNTCHHSVPLLYKTVNINIYTTITLSVVLYG